MLMDGEGRKLFLLSATHFKMFGVSQEKKNTVALRKSAAANHGNEITGDR